MKSELTSPQSGRLREDVEMALKAVEQYYESLKDLHPTTYILGQKVENPYAHPLIKHMLAGVVQTFALSSLKIPGLDQAGGTVCFPDGIY